MYTHNYIIHFTKYIWNEIESPSIHFIKRPRTLYNKHIRYKYKYSIDNHSNFYSDKLLSIWRSLKKFSHIIFINFCHVSSFSVYSFPFYKIYVYIPLPIHHYLFIVYELMHVVCIECHTFSTYEFLTHYYICIR